MAAQGCARSGAWPPLTHPHTHLPLGKHSCYSTRARKPPAALPQTTQHITTLAPPPHASMPLHACMPWPACLPVSARIASDGVAPAPSVPHPTAQPHKQRGGSKPAPLAYTHGIPHTTHPSIHPPSSHKCTQSKSVMCATNTQTMRRQAGRRAGQQPAAGGPVRPGKRRMCVCLRHHLPPPPPPPGPVGTTRASSTAPSRCSGPQSTPSVAQVGPEGGTRYSVRGDRPEAASSLMTPAWGVQGGGYLSRDGVRGGRGGQGARGWSMQRRVLPACTTARTCPVRALAASLVDDRYHLRHGSSQTGPTSQRERQMAFCPPLLFWPGMQQTPTNPNESSEQRPSQRGHVVAAAAWRCLTRPVLLGQVRHKLDQLGPGGEGGGGRSRREAVCACAWATGSRVWGFGSCVVGGAVVVGCGCTTTPGKPGGPNPTPPARAWPGPAWRKRAGKEAVDTRTHARTAAGWCAGVGSQASKHVTPLGACRCRSYVAHRAATLWPPLVASGASGATETRRSEWRL